MKKRNQALTTPSTEIMDLLGPPALWPSEDRELYQKLLTQVARDIRPTDWFGWMMVKNLADQLIEVTRYRRLQVAWMQLKLHEIKSEKVAALSTEMLNSPSSQKRLQVEEKLEQIERRSIGSESFNEPALKRELAELTEKEDNRLARLAERLSEARSGVTTDHELLSLLPAWIEVHEALDRLLRAAERQFDETCAEIEQHYRGLGRRIRESFGSIIEGTIIEPVASASAKLGRRKAAPELFEPLEQTSDGRRVPQRARVRKCRRRAGG